MVYIHTRNGHFVCVVALLVKRGIISRKNTKVSSRMLSWLYIMRHFEELKVVYDDNPTSVR